MKINAILESDDNLIGLKLYIKNMYQFDDDVELSVHAVQNAFDTILSLGLEKKQYLKTNYPNRSHILIFRGKPARADMIKKLGHIIYELQQLPTFPAVAPDAVSAAIKKIIGEDKRYTEKFDIWIKTLVMFIDTDYQPNPNYSFSGLLKIFPKDKITKMEFF